MRRATQPVARTPNISTAPGPQTTRRCRKAVIISDDFARRSIHRTCARRSQQRRLRRRQIGDTRSGITAYQTARFRCPICAGVVPQQAQHTVPAVHPNPPTSMARRAVPLPRQPRKDRTYAGQGNRLAAFGFDAGSLERRRLAFPWVATLGGKSVTDRIRRSRRLPPSVAIPGAGFRGGSTSSA